MEELQNLHILIAVSSLLIMASVVNADSAPLLRLEPGFSAVGGSYSGDFQPLLNDPTGVFSFGFLRINSTQLDLGVVHLRSSFTVWSAIPARPAAWSVTVSLSFNGSLVLSDSQSGVLWISGATGGDVVVLLNTSNLQIQQSSQSQIVWQSFDFPTDTLVQNQNFTNFSTPVISSDQRFSLRLSTNLLGLYMDFAGHQPVMYQQFAAYDYTSAGPPTYARVGTDGYLAMYQSNDSRPIYTLNFYSFAQGISGFRRVTLGSDSNLRAYRWNGTTWLNEYTAITLSCGLPTACGAYGLCSTSPGTPRCQCLDNSGGGDDAGSGMSCPVASTGDLCGSDGDSYRVVTRAGVELQNKDFLSSTSGVSYYDCMAVCAGNCRCWGAVYSNTSGAGHCYLVDYPIQTLVSVHESTWGYFKVRTTSGHRHRRRELKVALVAIGVLIAAGLAAFGAYRLWNWWRTKGGVGGSRREGLSPGPYRNLNTWASSKSIELFNSFKK